MSANPLPAVSSGAAPAHGPAIDRAVFLQGISQKLDLLMHFIAESYNDTPLAEFQAGQQSVLALRHTVHNFGAPDIVAVLYLANDTHAAFQKYAPETLITKIFANNQMASIELAGRIQATKQYNNSVEKLEGWQAQTLDACHEELNLVSQIVDEIATSLTKPHDGMETAAKVKTLSDQIRSINRKLDTLPRHISQHSSFSVWLGNALQTQKMTRDVFSRHLQACHSNNLMPNSQSLRKATPLPPAEQAAVIAARENRFWSNFQRQAAFRANNKSI